MKPLQSACWGLVAAILAGCAQAPQPVPVPARVDSGRVMSVETFDHSLLSTAIFEASNRVRLANGLKALGHLDELDAAADEQASYLALSLTVGHQNPFPNEHNIGERIAHAGLIAEHAAENAIMMPARRPADAPVRDYTYSEYAEFLLDGWMHSPDHRANMLDPRVTFLGCAARLSHGIMHDDQRVFATQVFYRPATPVVDPDSFRRP